MQVSTKKNNKKKSEAPKVLTDAHSNQSNMSKQVEIKQEGQQNTKVFLQSQQKSYIQSSRDL